MLKSPLLYDEKFCQGFFSGAYLVLGISSFYSKILMPILVAASEGSVWLTYIRWDLWWLIYLVIGWQLQFPSRWVWFFSLSACLVDFFVSVFFLISYSRTPLWDVWRASIFFNNFLSFLMAFFFFFYIFSYSTRKTFGIISPALPVAGSEKPPAEQKEKIW